ncbi:N-acetylmuramoyl-L-alanine amidase [Lysinibacillus fusiformis]|uniref:N-acetylmuramoyl-L-alanine amidase n=1 Tax=Lysinibacillus fusiformis TaxID=28031 RepID=A0A1E4QYL8_9BACI|nr:N-acetylmuramoyl-L-alanine amidase [Lysinibacillus fusiformis]ODV53301.1 hypothetical protein BG258_23655 [Lysinibacillus fusiformis]
MAFKMKYSIGTDYLPKGTSRRSGIKVNKVHFIVLHDVGNDGYNKTTEHRNGTTARGNINYYKNSPNEFASAHTFIDDKEILECIPVITGTPEKAWHVLYNKTVDNQIYGVDANDAAIGVELCYYPEDKARSIKAYQKYIWYCAYLAFYFGLDPLKCFSGHEKLDPGRKADPSNGLKWINKTTEQCIKDIIAEYNECTGKSDSIAQSSPQTAPSSEVIGIATVKVASLNVRTEARFNAPIVKTIRKGQAYKVFEKKNGLYRIGQSQWCSAGEAFVTFKSISHIGVIEILVDSLNVRNAPDFHAPILKTVSKNTELKVFKKENGMYNLGGNHWCSAGEKYVKFIRA